MDKWTREHTQDAIDLTWPEFQEKYSDFVSWEGWKHKRRDALNGRLPIRIASDILIPKTQEPKFEAPIRLNHATALILGDLHCPYHHETMLRRAFWVSRKAKIRTAVIIGDLFNLESISRHGFNGPFTSIDDEIASVKRVLRSFMQHFDEIYITLGNHDRRFSNRLDNPLGFQFVIDGVLGEERGRSKFITTDRDYIYLDHPAEEEARSWIVGHPSSHSSQGGKTPSDIALIEHRSVITGHNHVVGVSQSRDGRYLGVDTGHMTVEDAHHYKEKSLTKYAKWNAGFVVLEDGYATSYSERFSNWKKLGCE